MGKIGDYLSQPKLSNILAALIIFFASTQLGFHFWPSSALVYGIRIDYLAPTIYFLDLLIILYLFLKLKADHTLKNIVFNLSYLFPISLTCLIYSANPLATLAWIIHFFLYLLFIYSFETRLLKYVLPIAAIFQIIIAGIQVFFGRSIGGLLYFVGERNVAVGSPGIALTTFMDKVVLRAYGTFSHPNILAGWLVIVLLILLNFKPNTKLKIFYTTITTIGVILTSSRSAAISLFGIIVPLYLIKTTKYRIIYFLIVTTLVFQFSFLTPVRSEMSSLERQNLQNVSLSIIRAFPIFGTGANASISTYPTTFAKTNGGQSFRLLQPDHNSFTLFLSWFGLFGVIAILYLLRTQFENLRIYDLRFFIPILPLLIFDHYLLTSPQGLFILLLYLRVVKLK